MASDQERVITLLRALDREEIAAILDTDVSTVHQALRGFGPLPVLGGGGSNIVHGTDVADQAITILDPGQPQDVQALWRVNGPGVFVVAAWAEVNPAGDDDYAGLSLLYDGDDGGSAGSTMGPNARAFTTPGNILAGGWMRNFTAGGVVETLGPSQWRDYKLQAIGYAYNDLDPGDTTTPPSGDVQIRNVRVVAVRLDA